MCAVLHVSSAKYSLLCNSGEGCLLTVLISSLYTSSPRIQTRTDSFLLFLFLSSLVGTRLTVLDAALHELGHI